MAGHYISLLFIIRLKDAVQATSFTSEFKELKVFDYISHTLLQEGFWGYIFVVCRALYAPMRSLRLTDQKTPSMDKLYYFVLQTERMLPIWLEDAEYRIKRLLTDGFLNILDDTKDAGSGVFAEGSEDEDSDANNEDSGGGEVSMYITA